MYSERIRASSIGAPTDHVHSRYRHVRFFGTAAKPPPLSMCLAVKKSCGFFI